MPTSTLSEDLAVRTYFSPTVQAAVSQARRDLGEDATLLSSRRSESDEHRGLYEVVFGSSDGLTPQRRTAPGGGLTRVVRARPLGRRSAPDASASQISHTGITPLFDPSAMPDYGPSLTIGELEAVLERCGFGAALTKLLVNAVRVRLRGGLVADRVRAFSDGVGRLMLPSESKSAETSPNYPVHRLREALRVELESRLRFDPQAAVSSKSPVAAFIGPPGHGKTSSLIKLAVGRGLASGAPIRLICADTTRIGAAYQMERYAQLLGACFVACQTPEELKQAISARHPNELGLIDTPGVGPDAAGDDWRMAGVLAENPEITRHLVLMGTTRTDDLTRVAKRFDSLRPTALLFTRLDETEIPGVIAAEAVRSGKPLSFLGVGSRIPEDLRPALKEPVIEMLLKVLPAGEQERTGAR